MTRPVADLLADLESVARQYDFVDFGKDVFNEASTGVKWGSIKRHFKSQPKAMEALRAHLLGKGITLLPRRREIVYSHHELLEEMRRIWELVGSRPSKDEWNDNAPRISYTTYKRRFGGWQNACAFFLEHRGEPADGLGRPSSAKPASAPPSR